MKSRNLLRAICLLVLLASFIPTGNASALVSTALPPVDMFQLPWEQGLSWVAIDGLDNGTKRPLSSSHHYTVGGAIDFAPHNNMVRGEDTSNFWVTAAAAGTVVGISSCHMIIAHGNGWITQYQFLANVQVKLGDAVSRNQRLGIIADGVRQKFCPGSEEPNVPHLHFMLRPTMRNATFAGWEVNYLPVLNRTTFTKNGQTVGLFRPLLNVIDSPPTPTPAITATATPGPETPSPIASFTASPGPVTSLTPSSTPTREMSPTPTLFGPYVSTTVNPQTINLGETTEVTVTLHNVPGEGYTSAEFTCYYDASFAEVSNIAVTDLFGADAARAINGPQNNRFIVAIAGSKGNKATMSGTVFTFSVKGLQVVQTELGCEARVSKGDNELTQISSARTRITIVGSTTSTPTPNLTPSTSTVLPSTCDKAEFIADVNVPPGTVMAPGATFTKTWRLKNLGPCTWSTSYHLVFFYGEQMGAVSSVAFPVNVSVGQTVDVSINMTAPNAPGSYRGYWMFRNSNGANFGIGPNANQAWFVDINVSGPTLPPSPTLTRPPDSPTPTTTLGAPTDTPIPSITPGGPTVTPPAGVVYDFVANACSATWSSGAGQLPCPGTDGDSKGFVLKLNNPVLETGVTDTRPGLLTFPQNVQNGYIQGFYPPIHVQNGDRFRSIINCEYGATSCYAAFRLDYQVGSDSIKTFWGPFLERYEGQYYSVDVDLSPLAGKDVKFILTLLSAGSPTGDRAEWVGPYMYRSSGTSNTPGPTNMPAPSSTAAVSIYQNVKYNFKFTLPTDATIVSQNDNDARVNLTFTPGTNLLEKYLAVSVSENMNPCISPVVGGSPTSSENVTINNIQFTKQTGSEGAAGNIYDWVSYSTVHNSACISLAFILRSGNPGVYTTPPPLFDKDSESAVFEQIVATYTWLSQTPTATPGFETPLPIESLTPTFISTPIVTATGTPMSEAGLLVGKVLASKLVRIEAYNVDNNLVGAGWVNTDGTFDFHAASGTNSVIASASGFLSAQRSVTITDGSTTTLPTITLIAGDIDNNNVIDQFDALTIGMSYHTTEPTAADLNNDGIINVLDLELLAKNYRKTGPVVWE